MALHDEQVRSVSGAARGAEPATTAASCPPDEERHVARSRQLELVAHTSRQLILGNAADSTLLEGVFADVARHLDMEMFYHYRPTADPRLLRLAISGGVSEDERRLFSTMPVGDLLCGRVAERRAPLVVEDLPSSTQPGCDVLVASGAKSYIGFPLLAGDTLLGTLAFISRRRSHFREGEVQLIQTLCDQIAATLERARLLRDVQAAAARQAFLLALSDRLRPLTDAAAIQYEAAAALGSHLGAQRVGYAEDQGDGETIAVTRHYVDGVTSLEGRFRYDDYGPALLQAFRAGRAVLRPDIVHDDSLTDDEKTAHAALNLGATLNVPLLKHGHLVAVFFVHYRDPHAWTDDEVSLVTAVAERTWDAVQRGRTETALQASNERLRLAIDAAHAAVHDYDVLADRSVWSPALYELTGVPADTPVTLAQIEATIHPDDRSRISSAMAAAMDPCGSGSFVQEFRICRADSGAVRWVVNHSQTLFDGEGQARRPARSVGVLVDITERKVREERVRRLNELSTTLVRSRDVTAIAGAAASAIAQTLVDVTLVALGHITADAKEASIEIDYPIGRPSAVGRYLLSDYLTYTARESLRAGQSLAVDDVELDDRTAFASARYRDAGVRALVIVPLRAGADILASLNVNAAIPRHWRADDVQFVEDVAARAWPAIERARAEAGLAEREQRLRLALEAAEAAVYDSPLESAADAAVIHIQHVIGEPLTPITSEAWHARIHPDDRDRHLTALAAALTSERDRWTDRYRVRHADGSWRDVDDTAHIVRDTGGRPVRLVGTIVDVTEQVSSERALREVEARFRLIADQTPAIMWVTDPDGGIEFVNRAYCDFFGVTLDTVRGPNWQPLVHAEDAEAYVAAFVEASKHKSPFRADARVRHASGEWRVIESRGLPRSDEAGRYLGMVGLSLDVTDVQRATAQEREAARQKDEFIAVLAHELRNPLAPVRASVGILKSRAANDPVLQKCRDIIDRQVGHMARLLDDLLDVSRLARGKLTLQRRLVRLRDVVDTAVEMARPQIDDRQHTLTVEPIDPGIVLEADETRLAQVFANLLNNAAKYTNPGGLIGLSVTTHSNAVSVQVRDTGIGLDESMRGRLFDLFAQMDEARDRASGGLGIGLALTKRLVEMHGGTIDVASAGRERGASFTVTLPTDQAAAASENTVVARQDTETAGRSRAERRRVLIADDNVDAADTLTMLLETMECEVRTVYDGDAALRVAQAFRPELVLLDLGMPGLTGHAVCTRLRQQPWGTQVVIAAVTGWGQDEDRRRTRAVGFDCHLVKPVEPDTVLRLVTELRNRP